MSSTVLVTGATGFVANHILDQLLSKGYKVIGTGRSESRIKPFKDSFNAKYPKGQLEFEIVDDIAKDNAFDQVLAKHKDIKYVLHTASPFAFGLDKPFQEAYYTPAINGTTNILKGIKAHAPQVEHVVVTSSFAAIVSDPLKTEPYTNADWNPVTLESAKTENDAYRASKKYAELAAWDFVKNEKPNFTLSTVNPPFIFGPQVFDFAVGKNLNTSNEVIRKQIDLDSSNVEYQGVPTQLFVDVRDVAAFHILPLTNEKLRGVRSLLISNNFTAQEILNVINKNFPEGKFAKGDPSHPIGSSPAYDLSNVIELAGGYTFKTLEETVVDTVKQYLDVNK